MIDFKFFGDNQKHPIPVEVPILSQYEWSSDIRVCLPHIDIDLGILTLYDEDTAMETISNAVNEYYDRFENEELWQESLELFVNRLNGFFARVEVRRLIQH